MIPDPLAVAGRGLAVFPLPPGGRRAPVGWTARCTSDPGVLAATWPAGANIGVGCRASRIVGVDLDVHDDGRDGPETFAWLCARARAPWPSTFTVRTAHGGLHLYFQAPAGVVIGSSIGRWPGIDVRGPGRRIGGYPIGPGSVVDGRRYEVERDAPIVTLPAWLERLVTGPHQREG